MQPLVEGVIVGVIAAADAVSYCSCVIFCSLSMFRSRRSRRSLLRSRLSGLSILKTSGALTVAIRLAACSSVRSAAETLK